MTRIKIRILSVSSVAYLSEISKVPGFQHQRRRYWCCRSRSVPSTLDNHGHRELRSLERRDAEKPAVNPRIIIVHNPFIVLANDIAPIVALDLVPRLWLACFRVVNRHDFLRRPRLATGIDARSLHRPKYTPRRTTRTARDQPHNGTEPRSRLWRHDLIEHLRRHIHLDARLHQLAFHVSDRRRRQRHLERRHLAGIALPVSHKRKIVPRHLLAGYDRGFSWRERSFDSITARIPDLRQFPATQRLRRRVVRTDTQQLSGAFQSFRSKLHTHLRKILVTGNFVCVIDLDAAMHLAWSTIVKNHIRSGRCVVTTAAACELRILLAREEGRSHRHCFES